VIRAAAILACLALVGCSGGPPSVRYSDGFMRNVRNTANPSTVAATEIAFARAAREDGQWTAFRRFLADGGVIHGRSGVIDAAGFLATQSDPPVPVQWTPLAVWSSCDGQLAVTQGKFAEPDGSWGYYVTVWERQRNGTYRWSYDMGAPDTALTERENRDREPQSEDDATVIVVQAIPMIQGEVADCRADAADATGATWPDTAGATTGAATGGGISRDGSLAWRWVHGADGRRIFAAQQWRGEAWEPALDFAVTAEGGVDPQ
jgi:hypothetical protein